MSPVPLKPPSATWRDVPATVWTLGFVSLLMDVSSELIHSLLPVFLTSVLGASTVYVGLIEGIAEAPPPLPKSFRARSPIVSASASSWSASVMVCPPSPNRYSRWLARPGKFWPRGSSIGSARGYVTRPAMP
jgi:hypothetical protein